MHPAQHSIPQTQFRGKIWIFVALAVVFGGFAAFCLSLGPLFLFELVRSADGRPTRPAGIALCIFGVLFMLVFLLAAFNLAALRRPVLRLFREGIELNLIGATTLDGAPIPLPRIVRVAWMVLSLQGFKKQIVAAPWQTYRQAWISGLPMMRTMIVSATFYRFAGGRGAQPTPFASQIELSETEFSDSLDRIVASLHAAYQNPHFRNSLPSWNR